MNSFNEICKTEYAKTINKLMNDPLIKKILKEVKKMRPYLETKVVKVRKKKTYSNHIIVDGKKYILDEDEEENVYPHKEKGNWVNGECIDKIKFPCFCRFDHRKGLFSGKQGVHGIGIINRTAEAGEIQYQLSWADRQMENSGRLDILNNLSVLCTTPLLKRLIELYDIHILKGKIIIWEEK